MTEVGLLFLLVSAGLLLALPRPLAVVPLLLGTLYMPVAQSFEIAGANFPVVRLLVAVGMLRLMFRGEGPAGGWRLVDWMLVAWALLLMATSAFHTSEAWLYRAGIVWTELGVYLLFRTLMQDVGDIRRVFQFLCLMVVPLALLMLFEKQTGQNAFASLGAINPIALVRDGNIRATGPFSHPILAGTAATVCAGAALAVAGHARRQAALGLGAACAIVFACASSGPVMSVLCVLLGAAAWRVRDHMSLIRWTGLAAILILSAVMQDPVYFLMARIDITGGSQGYFRAQLIRSAIEHLPEWWMAGTDYTRHWMSSGVYANERHTDITNHYIGMGVLGGLPLMSVLIAILVFSFRDVGRALRSTSHSSKSDLFLIWMLGASLFSLAWTFMSISLFDQSVIFFYLLLASIQSSLQGCNSPAPNTETAEGSADYRGREAGLSL
jgi:hypothetical protein